MKKIKIHSQYKALTSDTLTPVSIYLKLRDKYNNPLLLESSDYHTAQNSFSFVCLEPLAGIRLDKNIFSTTLPDGAITNKTLNNKKEVSDEVEKFKQLFESTALNLKFAYNGLFGYTTYDAVSYFEDIDFPHSTSPASIPDLLYSVYKYMIVINHFNDEMYVIGHDTDENAIDENLNKLIGLLNNKSFSDYSFQTQGEEKSNLSNEAFKQLVTKGKEHCQRGDVFQIVLSRAFSQQFSGDEFNVYRALRSINPSPYLFYFDYGSFKLFGSSPEAQLVVKKDIAEIHPIAGTFKRSGNDEEDLLSTEKLKADKKENAEHIMLVDLARNDLSRNCTHVKVDKLKEVHFYSHVIHLVSKVIGTIKENSSAYRIMADSFPAGTLSGAPKHKAMQLIHRYEKDKRGYYGGCIGFMGFDNSFNHAIMIRTFLSKNNHLYYRAGAGVVVSSNEENELQEVNNKIGALRKAIAKANHNLTLHTHKAENLIAIVIALLTFNF